MSPHLPVSRFGFLSSVLGVIMMYFALLRSLTGITSFIHFLLRLWNLCRLKEVLLPTSGNKIRIYFRLQSLIIPRMFCFKKISVPPQQTVFKFTPNPATMEFAVWLHTFLEKLWLFSPSHHGNFQRPSMVGVWIFT